ncbi:MAG: hypothetical protein JJT76_18700 [Clostridiaceae bacterium]|nr:hypothetical protein [Clostridiaceae bacterium]
MDGLGNFYIGKKVHNEAIHNDLINYWKKVNNVVDIEDINYFSIYRNM